MNRATRLAITFTPTDSLNDDARHELFEFSDRFSTRHRRVFTVQLEKDDTIFIVRGRTTGHLIGFGTLTVVDVQNDGTKATIIYTGRAMIAREYRRRGLSSVSDSSCFFASAAGIRFAAFFG